MNKKITILVVIIFLIATIALLVGNYSIVVFQGPPGKITVIPKNRFTFLPIVVKIDKYLDNSIDSPIKGIVKITEKIKKNEELEILNKKKLIKFTIEIIKTNFNKTDKKK